MGIHKEARKETEIFCVFSREKLFFSNVARDEAARFAFFFLRIRFQPSLTLTFEWSKSCSHFALPHTPFSLPYKFDFFCS